MNEWSPGSNYTRPGTPNQSGKSIRTQKDELEKGSNPLVINIRAISDNNVRSVKQHSLEDITKSSLSISCKNKKTGNETSDPRFKKVISSSLQNDVCIGTDAVSSNKISWSPSKKEDIKLQDFSTELSNEKKSKNYFKNLLQNNECLKPMIMSSEEFKKKKTLAHLESQNFEQAEPPLKSVDNVILHHNKLVKSYSKESFSSCTINTINTSLASNDYLDELPNELSMLSSATRIKKVQNWIQNQKPKPQKKQSLITVIGQTQNLGFLSSALLEINKRRRLVKELDKYAISQKITATNKGKEASDSVKKVISLTPFKKKDKEINCNNDMFAKNFNQIPFIGNGSGDAVTVNEEIDGKYGCLNCAGSEFANSLSQKHSFLKRKLKKSDLINKTKIKDMFSVQYQWFFFLMFLTSGIICWIIFLLLHLNLLKSFNFFIKKPKTATWYEKICMWLWELFRPSGSYKRSISWNSY